MKAVVVASLLFASSALLAAAKTVGTILAILRQRVFPKLFFPTQPKEIFDEAKVANQAALDDAAAICGSRRISDDDRADVLEARRVRQFN